MLANYWIIGLKQGQKTQSIVLYDQIVLDFLVNRKVIDRKKGIRINDNSRVQLLAKTSKIFEITNCHLSIRS